MRKGEKIANKLDLNMNGKCKTMNVTLQKRWNLNMGIHFNISSEIICPFNKTSAIQFVN